jgi:hypothetical protein
MNLAHPLVGNGKADPSPTEFEVTLTRKLIQRIVESGNENQCFLLSSMVTFQLKSGSISLLAFVFSSTSFCQSSSLFDA